MTKSTLEVMSLVSAGATLGTGILAGAAHAGNRENDYHLPYALTCFAGTIVFVALAALHGATTFEAARAALHWHVAGTLVLMPAGVWLFSRFARHRMGRSETTIVLAGTAALLLANALSPASLRFASLRAAPAGALLPLTGSPGWPTAILHAWVLVPIGLMAASAWRIGRRGDPLLGAAAWSSVLSLFVANAIGARSDVTGGRAPYVGGPAVALFVIALLGLAMGIAQRRQRVALVAHAEELGTANARLREEMERRARLEQQLAENQRLEALGRMAAGVAHDFNNVLTVAGGHAALVRDRLAGGSDERRSVEQVVGAVDRGASLVRQLLAFACRQELAPVPFDADRALEDMRPLIGSLVGTGGIRVVIAPGAGGHEILADASQFGQVVMNLAVNARDAMPAGGQLTIGTRWVVGESAAACACDGSVPGGHLLITVADTGTGIDPDVLPRIFEPVFTTKPSGAGTGLGLATVHGIVRQSGGHIAVESRPGEGTTFRICWPGAPAGGPAAAPVRPVSSADRRASARPGRGPASQEGVERRRVRMADSPPT